MRGLREKRENLLEDYCRRCIRLRTIPQIIHKTDLKKKKERERDVLFQDERRGTRVLSIPFFPAAPEQLPGPKTCSLGKMFLASEQRLSSELLSLCVYMRALVPTSSRADLCSMTEISHHPPITFP